MNYATGYGVRVHIVLPGQYQYTYCGKRVYTAWNTVAPPAENMVCKNCKSATEREQHGNEQ